MPSRSSVNQRRWSSSPLPTPPTTASGGHLDIAEADGRMAVGIVVRVQRVIDELHALGLRLDQEQRGEPVGAVDDVGHHDQHASDVAGGDEPLLPVDAPAGVGGDGGGGDPAGIGAGLGLGDGVGVAALAAQRGHHVALDLLGAGLDPHVVDARDVPVQTVGDTAELLVDQEPLAHRPALPAELGRDPPALQARRDRLALDVLDGLLGEPASGRLGGELQRAKDPLDVLARPLLKGEMLVGEVGGRQLSWSCSWWSCSCGS